MQGKANYVFKRGWNKEVFRIWMQRQESINSCRNGEQRKLLDSWAYLSKEKREALMKVIELMNDNLYA